MRSLARRPSPRALRALPAAPFLTPNVAPNPPGRHLFDLRGLAGAAENSFRTSKVSSVLPGAWSQPLEVSSELLGALIRTSEVRAGLPGALFRPAKSAVGAPGSFLQTSEVWPGAPGSFFRTVWRARGCSFRTPDVSTKAPGSCFGCPGRLDAIAERSWPIAGFDEWEAGGSHSLRTAAIDTGVLAISKQEGSLF